MENEKEYKPLQIISKAWSFASPFKHLLLLSILFGLLYSLFDALTIAMIKPILNYLFEMGDLTNEQAIDIGYLQQLKENFFAFFRNLIEVQNNPLSTLINLGIVIVVLFLIKNIFKYFGGLIGVKFNEGVIKRIRDTVFEKVTSLSVDFFSTYKQGTIISNITNDVSLLNNSTIGPITTIIRDTFQVTIFLLFLIAISFKLTIIAFSTSIISLFFIKFSVKYLKKYAKRMQVAMADFTTTLQESIFGIRVIKAFNANLITNNRFKSDTQKYLMSAIKHKKVMSLVPAINELFAIIALSIVLVVGGHEVLVSKTVEADDLMTFLFMLFAIMTPITSLVNSFSKFQQGQIAGERILKILDQKPSVVGGKKFLKEFQQKIEIKHVSFAYNSNNVLNDVNIRIEKGKKVAFVGGSGSGKSTILDLIIRFYDPSYGEILIDGINVKEYDLTSYRALFGVVAQENILFNDTIANNIRYGNKDISDEVILESTKIANAFNFITNQEDGFNSLIGDRGLMLSGGERQRIAIARALARNPEILIFDEATSALDSESERIVQRAIDNSLKDKTAIIVAHRLATIIDCDMIYVFDKGNIVEYGNHSQLIERKGVYRKLYEIQFAERNL